MVYYSYYNFYCACWLYNRCTLIQALARALGQEHNFLYLIFMLMNFCILGMPLTLSWGDSFSVPSSRVLFSLPHPLTCCVRWGITSTSLFCPPAASGAQPGAVLPLLATGSFKAIGMEDKRGSGKQKKIMEDLEAKR